MNRKAPTEDGGNSFEELSEVLAEATHTTPEEIERGAKELEIAPAEEAEIVGYGGPLTDSDSRHNTD